MPVAVITDSTAHLPEGFADRYAIREVPLHVLVDGSCPVTEFGPEPLAEALSQRRVVTTSRPAPAEFAAMFRAALDAGASGVVSVHLSRELSGTWESAVLASQQVDAQRIRVVDSRTTAMGLGFAALRAAEAAGRGESGAEVEAAAMTAARHSETLFAVETLEYLHRGGRIGKAAALLGTALAVKPVLHMSDGEIRPLEKVRTMQRAMTRLVDRIAVIGDEEDIELAVHHLAAPERAGELATRIEERLPHARGCVVSELGPVIGAHTGPGVLGVVVQRSGGTVS